MLPTCWIFGRITQKGGIEQKGVENRENSSGRILGRFCKKRVEKGLNIKKMFVLFLLSSFILGKSITYFFGRGRIFCQELAALFLRHPEGVETTFLETLSCTEQTTATTILYSWLLLIRFFYQMHVTLRGRGTEDFVILCKFHFGLYKNAHTEARFLSPRGLCTVRRQKFMNLYPILQIIIWTGTFLQKTSWWRKWQRRLESN